MVKLADVFARTKKPEEDEYKGSQENGLLEPGNIDLGARPTVKNPDGTISTVRSASFNFDGVEVLLPTVSEDGRIMDENETIETYKKTGQHLGKFKDPTSASAYAQRLHEDQAEQYAPKTKVRSAKDLFNPQFKIGGNLASVTVPEYNPPKINYERAGSVYQSTSRPTAMVSGDIVFGRDGKPIVIKDDLADELAYSNPSYFDAVKTRVNELGEKLISNPLKSALWDAPIDFAATGPGIGEFVLSAGTDLLGAFAGVVTTSLETEMRGIQMIGGSIDNLTRVGIAALTRDEDAQPEIEQEHPSESIFQYYGNRLTDNVESMRDALRYEPRTETGKALTGLFGMGFAEIAEMGDVAGDKIFERTGSPLLATAARIVPEAVMMLGPLGLRRTPKGDKVMDVVEDVAAKRAAGIEISVFDPNLIKQFDTLTPDEVKTMAKLKRDVRILADTQNRTPEQETQFANLKKELKVLTDKEMTVEQNSINTVMSSDEILRYVTDEDLAKANPDTVTSYLFGEGMDGPVKAAEPVVLVQEGGTYKIQSGIEAAAASKLFGETRIPVKIIVKQLDQATVDKLSTVRGRVIEATEARKIALDRARRRTVAEKAASWIFDRNWTVKNRLLKEFGKDAVPAIQLAEGLRHSSTSGGMFAKIVDRKIFSTLTNKEVAKFDLGNGKTQVVTELDAFNRIVNNRVALAIAKRRPDQKFSANMRAVHYEADLVKLRQAMGEQRFNELNNKASALIGPRGFYNELLQRKFRAGLISKDQYKRMKNFDYEPTRYLEELDPVLEYDTLEGSTITQRSSGVEALTGGKTSLVELDARTLFVDLALRTHKQIATNNSVRALARLAEANPKNKLIRKIDKTNKQPPGTLKIEYFENGKKRSLAVDPSFGELWKFSTPDMIEQSAKVLAWASGSAIVKQASVGLNPLFFLRDIPRNITMMALGAPRMLSGKALYASNWDYVPGVGAMFRPALAAYDMFSVLPDAITRKGLFDSLAENNAFPTFLADVAMQELHPVYKKHPKMKRLADALSWTNQTSEIVMRMAVAKRALRRQQERGEPQNMQEAAYEASRIIDYGQSGYISGALDHVIPFFNPATQGARTVLRGFAEDPVRNSMFAANVIGMAATAYLWNYLRAPETMSQIPEEHLMTGLVFPLADWMRSTTPDGDIVYPYVHIPIDNLLMPFVGSANWLMRYNITGEIPSRPIRDMLTNITPGGGVPSIPTLDALTKLFSNYDTWKSSQVFPNPQGISRYMEYYPVGTRKETPRMYVWAGEQMNALGLGNVDVASPERLRAAVDTFVGSSPFSHLWAQNFDPLLEDPASYKGAMPFDQMIAQQPGIRSVFKMTHPSINAFRESDTMMKPYGDLQKRMNDRVETELRRAVNTKQDPKVIAKQLFSDPNYPTEVKEIGMRRFMSGYIYNRVVASMPADSRVGLPGLSWWQNTAQSLNPRDRATLFFSEWKRKSTPRRNAMWNMARRMSVPGIGFSYIDQQKGLFLDEFNKLKSRYGDDVESSWFDTSVDVASPSLVKP